MLRLFVTFLAAACFTGNADARKFNDTGVGTIIFEEAWTVPELLFQSVCVALPPPCAAQI